MRYALIKNGVVDNIIEYDEESLLPDLKRYEDELSTYDVELKAYKKETQERTDEYNSHISDLAALQLIEISKEEKEKRKKAINKKIGAIRLPKHPKIPKPAKGKFTAPEDCDMVEAPSGCFIGQAYVGGEFINQGGE